MPVPVPAGVYATSFCQPMFGSSAEAWKRSLNFNNISTNSLLFQYTMASFQPYANFTQSMQSQQNAFQYRSFANTPRFPLTSPLTVGSTPSPPLNFPPSAISVQQFQSAIAASDIKSSVGILISVNSLNGVIAFSSKASEDSLIDETNYVNFDIKNFGDQAVTDLLQVLRIGFALKFQAVQRHFFDGNNQPKFDATFVAPPSSEDLKSASQCNMTLTNDIQRLPQNLDTPSSAEISPEITRQHQQPIPYNVAFEIKALHLLTEIFRQNNSPQCALHTIHCIVSNCRDDIMYNYIGKSSLKRRQFIEQRCHLFYIGADDTVCLVPGALYVAVTTLVREMLKRGGAMLLQELFDSYLTWPDLPLEAREIVGDSKQQFLKFLETFQFSFSVFPSRVFVSVRRKMPDFDYSSFLIDCFGDEEGSPFWNGSQQQNTAGIICGPPLPPPPLTPSSTCQTPSFRVPSTPYSAASNFSGSNDDSCTSSTKFTFPSNAANHHDKNSNFVNVWSTNFDDTLQQPAPHVHSGGSGNVSLQSNQFSSQNSQFSSHNAVVNVVNTSATNSSSVGSSSLSLASYSSDPVPPTPPMSNQHPLMFIDPFGQRQQFSDFNFNSSNAALLPSSNAPYNLSLDNSFSATPGFWKSYDLGTEDLVKNLTRYSNQSRCQRSTPSPSDSSLFTAASTSSNMVNTSPDSNVHYNGVYVQTEGESKCFCPRCGYDKIIVHAEPKIRCFAEIGCQTMNFDEENVENDDEAKSEEEIIASVAEMALDD